MKKKTSVTKSLKKQLISGTVYVALAAVVVAVTVNTTVGLLSGDGDPLPIDSSIEKIELPSLPEIPQIDTSSMKLPSTNSLETSPVSENAKGITDIIADETSSGGENLASSSNSVVDDYGIPIGADLGIDKFIKPCDGFITVSHSTDIPVYSPTLSDFRTHIGVDIAESLGTEIVAVNGGIISDIYYDDLFGMTVETTGRDGTIIRYSNLSQTLSGGIEKGAVIKTGTPIGGIGETAICEAVETPHVHLEMYDADMTPLNPEDYISF